MTASIAMTPLRLAWLRKLAECGPTRREDMPLAAGGRVPGSGVWVAMQHAGFIAHADGEFSITTTGRAVLEKAQRVADSKEIAT